jgi:hypothetical protein
MKQLYGAAAFTSAYGDKPNPMWTAAIGRLTDDECRAGLGRIAQQSRDFAPNLTQFVAACRYKGTQSTLGPPTTPEALRKALPPPEKQASREKIDGWLAKMRARLA